MIILMQIGKKEFVSVSDIIHIQCMENVVDGGDHARLTLSDGSVVKTEGHLTFDDFMKSLQGVMGQASRQQASRITVPQTVLK